jgi:hypothetical protein
MGNGIFLIPSDLVVEYQAIDSIDVIYGCSGTQTSFKRHAETGNQGLNCFYSLKSIGLPLNPMECGFSHPEFQDRYLAFMEAFVERYPWVTHFTVINEPVFTTWFCARQGIWHPRRRGDDAFVRMLNDVCKTICTISNMLIDRVPGLTLVHPDRSKKTTELMKLGFCMRGFLMRSVG